MKGTTDMWLTSFSIERINTLPHSLDDIDYIRISFQGLYKTISIIQRNGRGGTERMTGHSAVFLQSVRRGPAYTLKAPQSEARTQPADG